MFKYISEKDTLVKMNGHFDDEEMEIRENYPNMFYVFVPSRELIQLWYRDEKTEILSNIGIDFRWSEGRNTYKILDRLRKQDIRYNPEARISIKEWRKKQKEQEILKRKKSNEDYIHMLEDKYKGINGWWIPINGKMVFRSTLS